MSGQESPYQLRYLALAQSDLAGIVAFNRQFSDNYQNTFLSSLKAKCENLQLTPLLYPPYEYDRNFRKMPVGDYLVFYKVDEKNKQVSIYRILHGRRDISAIMEK